MTRNNTFTGGTRIENPTVTKQLEEIIFRFRTIRLVIQTIIEMDPITVIGETISVIVIAIVSTDNSLYKGNLKRTMAFADFIN